MRSDDRSGERSDDDCCQSASPAGKDPAGKDPAGKDLAQAALRREAQGQEDQIDEDLLLSFQSGDRDAFAQIVGRFETPLWRFFYRLCWDRERAEDFVQDVFLRVFRSADRYEPRGRLSTFLYRIATNRWIDHWRSMRPRPSLYSLDAVDREEEAPILDRVVASNVEPGAELESRSEKERLRLALDSLSLPHRLVFELAVYQNLPYPQISELLSIPIGTVKSRMHNTTKVLKQLLSDEDEETSTSSHAGRRRTRA